MANPCAIAQSGPKGGIDVGFHVVEEVKGGMGLEVCFAAPEGIRGSVVIDVGLVET